VREGVTGEKRFRVSSLLLGQGEAYATPRAARISAGKGKGKPWPLRRPDGTCRVCSVGRRVLMRACQSRGDDVREGRPERNVVAQENKGDQGDTGMKGCTVTGTECVRTYFLALHALLPVTASSPHAGLESHLQGD
jgi:hypothetical protein